MALGLIPGYPSIFCSSVAGWYISWAGVYLVAATLVSNVHSVSPYCPISSPQHDSRQAPHVEHQDQRVGQCPPHQRLEWGGGLSATRCSRCCFASPKAAVAAGAQLSSIPTLPAFVVSSYHLLCCDTVVPGNCRSFAADAHCAHVGARRI